MAAAANGPQIAARLWAGREAFGKAEGSGMLPVLRLPLNLTGADRRYRLSGTAFWLRWLDGPAGFALAVAGNGAVPHQITYQVHTTP